MKTLISIFDGKMLGLFIKMIPFVCRRIANFFCTTFIRSWFLSMPSSSTLILLERIHGKVFSNNISHKYPEGNEFLYCMVFVTLLVLWVHHWVYLYWSGCDLQLHWAHRCACLAQISPTRSSSFLRVSCWL